MRLRLGLLLLPLLLQSHNRRTVKHADARELAGLECATIEARTIVVVTLPNYFAAVDDDAAVTIVQGGLGGLLEAERKVGIGSRRHFGVC